MLHYLVSFCMLLNFKISKISFNRLLRPGFRHLAGNCLVMARDCGYLVQNAGTFVQATSETSENVQYTSKLR